jgi:hypothetical protein
MVQPGQIEGYHSKMPVRPTDDEFAEVTAVTANACPDCGSEMVLINIEKMMPPDVVDIWGTIFAGHCVKSPWWRWCCGNGNQGHLSVWVARP